jgi:two-component system, cell cycle sensor histidine kinase and response regulator CckA
VVRALRERQELLERLLRIQRSISHGAPLQEVLEAIAGGAAQLLGDPVGAVRLVDAGAPDGTSIASAGGVADDLVEVVRRGRLGDQAIAEERLVVVEHDGLPGAMAAMAAPVREHGAVVGSIVVASFDAERTYSGSEQEALLAFAEHAGLALADARIIERRGRMAERRYRAMIETTSEGVWVLDADGRTIFVNGALERMTGRPAEDLLGRHPADLVADDQRELVLAAIDRHRSGAAESYEVRLRRTGTEPLQVLVSATPMPGDDGASGGSLALLTDISDLARAQAQTAELEERLQRAHVLEGIGRVAGQIAHDFNHVLGLVVNYTAFARDALPDDSPAQDDLAQVISAAEHGAALTGQLMAFGRTDPGLPESVDVAELAHASLALLRRTVPAGVTVHARSEPGLRRVHADPAQLRQVLLNLIANALDAMPDGGELEIAAGNDDHDHYVVLTVRDTGSGMEPDVLARAAEPMFTTKPLGSGTGFGLAIASGIVQRAGGRLELRSRAGEGTTAEVLLPMAGAPAARDDPPAEWIAAGMRPQTGTILLVEDDDAVREVTRRILVHHGYEVLEAAGAGEAVEVAGRPGAAIDLLLTDNAMGEVSGLELVARLDAHARGIRVIVMSGYVAESSPAGEGATIAWLQKPFGATSLITAVRASLSAPPP